MIFTPAGIEGAFFVDIEPQTDERGFFARTFCREQMAAHGLFGDFDQNSVSFNKVRGTLRGMHFQLSPHEETKLVRCTAGAIYDVILDIRPNSSTCGRWVGAELSVQNHRALYIPSSCAHGFITLADDSEVYYQIAGKFVPKAARGIRWNDPAFGIDWPIQPYVMSTRDRDYPDYGGGTL